MSDGGKTNLKIWVTLILVGALLTPLLFLLIFILITFVTGMGASGYLGPLETKIIMYLVAPTLGASIGYLIGKRRNHNLINSMETIKTQKH